MWEHVPEDERDGVRARALDLLREVERSDGELRFVQGVRHTLGRLP